jgi:ribonuclease D
MPTFPILPGCPFPDRSNWALRPLDARQMEYAALDVLTLPLVLERLLNEAARRRAPIAAAFEK